MNYEVKSKYNKNSEKIGFAGIGKTKNYTPDRRLKAGI